MTKEIVTEKINENFDTEYVSCDFPLISVMCAKNDYKIRRERCRPFRAAYESRKDYPWFLMYCTSVFSETSPIVDAKYPRVQRWC